MARAKQAARKPSPNASKSPKSSALPTLETSPDVSPQSSVTTATTTTDSCDTVRDLRGRPSHDICHVSSRPSLLSHRNKKVNLRGLFNLSLLILFAQNFRLVIENLMKYGVRIKPLSGPSDLTDLVQNWPILLSLILMHGSFCLAFAIEKFVNPRLAKHSQILSVIVTWGNSVSVILIPYVTVKLHHAEPLSASALLAFSITWFLKLWSFHHVMLDIRYSLDHDEGFEDTVEGKKASRYPESLKFKEFYVYLIMPTLCYQLDFPRTPKIRWLSIVRHLLEMTACLIFMKVMIEQYLVVVVENTFLPADELRKLEFYFVLAHLSERILKLSVPNLCVWLLMFVALFHHWLNILAEVTRFGDREFYRDWWNSGSFEEYWKKWNLPIHNFFNRHVNKPLLRQKIPKVFAGQIVFIISALAHEYMICVPLHVGWTGLVFTAFMLQVPLIYVTSSKFFQTYPTVGNLFFWISFCFTGQPVAILAYYYLWGVKHGSVPEVDIQQIHQLAVL